MLSSIRGVTLKQSTDFVYLGGKISDSADLSADIARRIGLATGVARSLAAIWKSKVIAVATKIRLYNTSVLPVLLYNAETWTMKEKLNRKLLVFEMTVLRCIAGVTRRDRRRNTYFRLELGVTRDVVNHIRAKRLSYFGHVARRQSSRIPNIMMYGRVQGRRPVGRPKKRWLDNSDSLESLITPERSVNGIRIRV